MRRKEHGLKIKAEDRVAGIRQKNRTKAGTE